MADEQRQPSGELEVGVRHGVSTAPSPPPPSPPPLPHRLEEMGVSDFLDWQDDDDGVERRQRLSTLSYVFIAVFLLIWILITLGRPVLTAVYPLFFIPLIALLYRAKHSAALSQDFVLRAFGTSFVCGPLLLLVAVSAMLGFVYLLSGIASSVLITLFCVFFPQVAVEEFFKFLFIRRTLKRADAPIQGDRFSELRSGLYSSTAISLGYGTFQGLIITILVVRDMPFIDAFFTSLLVALLYIPFHCLTGYLIGLQLSRNEILDNEMPAWLILLVPTVSRTFFLFQFFFSAMFLNSFYMILYWLGISFLVVLSLLLYIRSIKLTLPEEFLENAGYNSLLNLGAYHMLEDISNS